MLKTTSKFELLIKDKAGAIKKFITVAIVSLVILSIAYFVYWGTMINDEELFEYSNTIMYPIAHYFFPNNEDSIIYRDTGIKLLVLVVPCFIAYFIIDSFEHFLLKMNAKVMTFQDKKTTKAQEIKYTNQPIKQDIEYFSISASFDYAKNKKSLSPKTANRLNKVIYENLKAKLRTKVLEGKIITSGIFTIISKDFKTYDILYTKFLKVLASIKKEIQNSYGVEVIPTITTDAFETEPKKDNILKAHFAIKGCNFKNKAVTTHIFLTKYRELCFDKYGGVSIGLYSQIVDSKAENFDLNIVFKNLSEVLDSIGN